MRRMTIHRLWAAKRGSVTILFAGALVMLFGATALAVDIADVYLAKRHAQGIADAAALAAASDVADAGTQAAAARDANAMRGLVLKSVVTGSYVSDSSVAVGARFTANASNPNAAQVLVSVDVPVYFGKLFGSSAVTVEARGTAARVNLAAFSLGTQLASVDGGLPNAILSQLAGTDLQLSAMDYQALVSAHIDIMRFVPALRAQLGVQTAAFGDILKLDATLPQLARAMAAAVDDATAAAALNAVAARLPATIVRPATLIDLGPLSEVVAADPSAPIVVDAFGFLRATLEFGGTHYVSTDVDLAVPGVASSHLTLVIGERPAHSPWLAVGRDRSVTVRTAQTRMYLDARIAPPSLSGLATLRLPIYAELAPATATLNSVSCAQGRQNASVSLDVTPSLGEIAIADVSARQFADIGQAVTLNRAVLATTPLASVTGSADMKLGGATAQTVTFSAADISGHVAKTVATQDIAQTVASSLISRMNLQVAATGLGVTAGPLTAAAGSALNLAAPAIDALFAQVGALSGVRVGAADAWVDGVRCGTPVLVG